MTKLISIDTDFTVSTCDFKGGSAYFHMDSAPVGTRKQPTRQQAVTARNSEGIEQGTIILDFDADGKLFGIEVMFAEWVLPESLYKRLDDLHTEQDTD